MNEIHLETKLDLLLVELNVYGQMIEELANDMDSFNQWLKTQLEETE